MPLMTSGQDELSPEFSYYPDFSYGNHTASLGSNNIMSVEILLNQQPHSFGIIENPLRLTETNNEVIIEIEENKSAK